MVQNSQTSDSFETQDNTPACSFDVEFPPASRHEVARALSAPTLGTAATVRQVVLGPARPRGRTSLGGLHSKAVDIALSSWVGGFGTGEAVACSRDLIQDVKGGVTFNDAVVTMIINCIGASIVMLPKQQAETGIFTAPLLIVICAFSCCEAGCLICYSCSAVEGRLRTPVRSYEALAAGAGGLTWQLVLTCTKNFAMLGFVVSYLQLVVEGVSTFFPGPAADKPVNVIRFCMVMPVFILLAMLKDLEQLARFAPVGVAAVFVECGGLMLGGILEFGQRSPCRTGEDPSDTGCRDYGILPRGEPSGYADLLGSSCAIFLFSFAVLATVPSLRGSMVEPERMPAVLRTSFSAIACVNIIVMTVSYMGFGLAAPDNATTVVSEDFRYLGFAISIAIIFNLLMSTPLITFCLMSFFESTGTDAIRTPMTFPNMGVRLALVVGLTVIGNSLPYVAQIVGLVSSVFGVCNNIMFPILFHFFVLGWGRGASGVLRALAVAVGFSVMFFGFKGSLQKLEARLAGG